MNYRTNSDILECNSYASLYHCSVDLVYVNYHNKHKYIFKQNNKLYVQVDKLTKRREFAIKIWNQSIDNYYLLIDTIGYTKLITILCKNLGLSRQNWGQFLDRNLFSPAFKERNLLSYKVNKKLWRFYRFTQQYIRSKINVKNIS